MSRYLVHVKLDGYILEAFLANTFTEAIQILGQEFQEEREYEILPIMELDDERMDDKYGY